MGVVGHHVDVAEPRELAGKRTQATSFGLGRLLIDVSIPCEPVPGVSDIANLQREVVAEGVCYTQAVICHVGSFEVRVHAHDGALTWIPRIRWISWYHVVAAEYSRTLGENRCLACHAARG